MLIQLQAYQCLLDSILEDVFNEIAVAGLNIARRHRAGARTLTELIGLPPPPGAPAVWPRRERRVRVNVDEWIVELIEELVESQRPSRVRGFIQSAVLAYVDQMACAASAVRDDTVNDQRGR